MNKSGNIVNHSNDFSVQIKFEHNIKEEPLELLKECCHENELTSYTLEQEEEKCEFHDFQPSQHFDDESVKIVDGDAKIKVESKETFNSRQRSNIIEEDLLMSTPCKTEKSDDDKMCDNAGVAAIISDPNSCKTETILFHQLEASENPWDVFQRCNAEDNFGPQLQKLDISKVVFQKNADGQSDEKDGKSTSSIRFKISDTLLENFEYGRENSDKDNACEKTKEKRSNKLETKMNGANKSEVWDNFKKIGKDKACCNHCNKMLSCKGSSTSSLHNHLKVVHQIIIIHKKTETNQTIDKQETPGPSSCPQKQASIFNFVKRSSLEEIISKLAAQDGMSINSITTSSFIRESLQQRGYLLPKNNCRVMNLIYTFYEYAKRETINEFDCIKQNEKKFSITLDEWTSKRNRRYLNINVHHLAEDFNLGLVPIASSCDAKKTLELVSERLQIFNLDLATDIVASTNDGAAVMKKFGQLSPIIDQLCYSHAIHLAVTDVLYKNKEIAELDVYATSQESEDDMEPLECEDDCGEDFLISYELDNDSTHSRLPMLSDNYKESISQIRKICKFFRKSPVRDSILQNYVKQEKGKELSLILDCQTRWNSLEAMVERFITLKECVVVALNDIGASHMWNEAQYPTIIELVKILGPIRLAAEALGRRDSNLLTSEGIFEFLLKELKNLKTDISSKFFNALLIRINERRQVGLISLLRYLQNPQNLSANKTSVRVGSVLPQASKLDIIKLSEKILFRIYPNSSVERETDSDDEYMGGGGEETNNRGNDIALKELKEAMEKSIHKFLEEPEEIISNAKTLKAEFSIYEATNKRTRNLDLLFDALKTIKPSSVASERVFSISGNIVSKIRTRLSNRSVDSLCFLKSYFLKKNTK